jgi:phospholipase D3/4
VPDNWPTDLSTKINAAHPLAVTRPGLSVYAASSPPPFCPLGREEDGDAIVKIIDAANVFVRVAVMDYFPATIYGGTKTKFWPIIDNAIRRGTVSIDILLRALVYRYFILIGMNRQIFFKSFFRYQKRRGGSGLRWAWEAQK